MSYKRKKEDTRRLRKTYESTGGYLVGVYYSDRKQRYVRFYQGKKAKYFRKCSNKRVRKEPETLQYGKYRRAYDYWWKLW